MSGGTQRQPAPEPPRQPRAEARGRSSEKDDDELVEKFFREQRSIGRYERLQNARQSSGELFDRLREQNLAEAWSSELLPAAEHMLDALSQLTHDVKFWAALEAAECSLATLSHEQVITVQEIMNSHLVESPIVV